MYSGNADRKRIQGRVARVVLLGFVALGIAAGDAGAAVAVSLTPAKATLNPSQTLTITPTVTGATNTAVTWKISSSSGALSTGGAGAVYAAPAIINTAQTITITATSMADTSKTASVILTLIPLIAVAVSPMDATASGGQAVQFSSQVSGSTNQGVLWSVSPAVGSIQSSGLYTAPAQVTAAQTVTVTATSVVDQSKIGSQKISLTPLAGFLASCSFSTSAAPCTGVGNLIVSATLDPAGILGSALRICKGAGCPGTSAIRLTGKRLSVRRGTIAFWIKQNNNNPTSGPTEIFNTFPGDPYVGGSFTASVSKSINAVTGGATTTLNVPGHGFSTGANISVSGGTGAWTALNQVWQVTVVDANTFTVPLNSTALGAFSGTASLLTAGAITVGHYGDSSASWTHGVFTTDPFFLAAGQWHHFAWSWTADHHQIYRDGVLVGEFDSASPFPYASTFPFISVGTQSGGTQDISIDEFGSYDFNFNAQEEAALWQGGKPVPSGPPTAVRTVNHGVNVRASWGPGEQKVKVSLDGGDFGGLVQKFHADVYQNGAIVSSQDFPQTNGGFAEGLISLPSFPSGTYSVSATAYNAAGGVVASAASAPYVFTQPAWLGNQLGIDTSVPAPYFTPISVSSTSNLDLEVVNRTYALTGGYGLPMQMTSLGQKQLASPVTLNLISSGAALNLSNQTLSMTNVQPDVANWTGSAVAGGSVNVSVTGKLEYDGMMLLTLQLAPVSGPVSLDGIKLQTNLTGTAAKYVYAVKDQPYWWYVWSVRPPQAPGEFNNNLSATPRKQKTDNIFSVVFSDDDRGLQIFHNNMAGWQLNEKSPWQRFIRNADGTVTYECDLANQTFTLSQPITITIGYMATPVKNLPSSWRLATGGAYGGRQAPTSNLEYGFDFTLGNTWSTFSLLPVNLATFKSADSAGRATGKLELPFTNAHVLVPTAPATSGEMSTLAAETVNDGWNSSPSKGEGDYWAWSLNRLLNDPTTPNVVDGYYIDESYGFLANASLLTGAGYIKADGTHGVGLNLLGARQNFQRLAKILMAAGKTPNLWMHTTAYSAPHMYSHALMTFDGERPTSGTYYVDATSSTTPDHFDTWNANNSMLDPTQSGSGSWLLGTAQTRKFGFIPNMWRGIQCCNLPYFNAKQRQAECLYQMNDMLQQDQTLAWWQPKANFGLDQPDVTYHGFLSQQELQTTDPNVRVTYYRRTSSILAYIANFNNTDWTGNVSATSVGLAGVTSGVIDAETGTPLTFANNAFNLTVSRHNCRVVQFGH